MNKILVIIFVLIIVFSAALVYNIYTDESSKDDVTGYYNGVTSNDLINELDDSLLDEDYDIEIGEMV